MGTRSLLVARLSAGVVGCALVGSSIVGAQSAGAVSPPVRYAAPGASITAACSSNDPCELSAAINNAPTGSTIVVEPGVYGSQTAPLAEVFNDAASRTDLTIVGPATGEPAVVYSSDANAFILNYGSAVSNLTIVSSGSTSALTLNGGSSATRMVVSGSAVFRAACFLTTGTITDSLCQSTGTGAAVAGTGSGASGTTVATARGVTAVTGSSAVADFQVDATGSNVVTLNVTNSIGYGTGAPTDIEADDSTASASIALAYSDVSGTPIVALNGGSGSVSDQNHDVSVVPHFVDPSAGNYWEKSTSPTIDKGTSELAGDTTDLAGNPRTLGSAPDIGAYEFIPAPSTPRLSLVKRGAHSLKIAVTTDPEGLPTKVELYAAHGKTHLHSTARSAGSGRTAKVLTITISGLKRHTKYRLDARATSSGGHATSAVKQELTKR